MTELRPSEVFLEADLGEALDYFRTRLFDQHRASEGTELSGATVAIIGTCYGLNEHQTLGAYTVARGEVVRQVTERFVEPVVEYTHG